MQREVAQGQQKVDEQAKQLAEQQRQTALAEAALSQQKLEADRKKAEADAAARTLQQAAQAGKSGAELAPAQQAAGRTAAEAQAAEDAAKAQAAALAAQKAEDQKKAEELAAQQKALQQEQAQVAAEAKTIQSDQAAVRAQQTPEQVQQDLARQSEQLAQREAALAQQQEELKKGQTDASIFAGLLYYLKIKEYLTDGHYNNEIYAINAATAKVVVKSPVTTICGRKYDIFTEGVVVITYKGDHRAGHFLTLLDLKTLEVKATGTDAVFWRSFVEVRDGMAYAILNRDNTYYLGRFDAGMKTVAVSVDKVDPDSFISFFGDLIYINSADKKILVLNKPDLSTKGMIEP
jgi:glucan-binding YG repeat protein